MKAPIGYDWGYGNVLPIHIPYYTTVLFYVFS